MTKKTQENAVEKVDLNEELSIQAPIETTVQTTEIRGESNINNKFNLLLDIAVTLSIEMGCKNIKLKDLLKLNKSSIVELDRMAGDPLDIKVNGSLIARGEVVVINDHYGIRITEIVSHHERIDSI